VNKDLGGNVLEQKYVFGLTWEVASGPKSIGSNELSLLVNTG